MKLCYDASCINYATGSTNARGNHTLVHVSQDTQEIRHSMCFSTLHLPVIEDNEEAVATFNIQIKAELKNATWASNDVWTCTWLSFFSYNNSSSIRFKQHML